MWLEKSKNIHSTKTINNYVGQLKHFNLLVKMGTKEDRWSVIAKFCFVALFALSVILCLHNYFSCKGINGTTLCIGMTFSQLLNHDFDLEYNNPIFSQDTPAYDDVPLS